MYTESDAQRLDKMPIQNIALLAARIKKKTQQIPNTVFPLWLHNSASFLLFVHKKKIFPSFISRPQTFCRAARRWSYATNTLFVSSQEIRRRANSRLQQNSHLQLNLEESKNMKSLFGLVISACRRRVSVLRCGEDNESHQTPQKLQVVLENSKDCGQYLVYSISFL